MSILSPEQERVRKWDLRFLGLAKMVSTWSKDPSTRVGAVLVRPDLTICSVGYNGFPRGVPDRQEDLNTRERKYSRIIHAEVNAILNAHERVDGYTLYVWPPGYGPTCDRCATQVIQSGITRVVGIRSGGEFSERWRVACEDAIDMYKAAGVEVLGYAEVPDLV